MTLRLHVPILNVVIFGETGVGKSPLINLIPGLHQAKTSPDADVCTERNQDYKVTIANRKFKIWGTVSLNEGTFSRIHAAIAEKNLKYVFSRIYPRKVAFCSAVCMRRGLSRANRLSFRIIKHSTPRCASS